MINVPAKDELPTNSEISDVREAKNRNQSDNGGVAS